MHLRKTKLITLVAASALGIVATVNVSGSQSMVKSGSAQKSTADSVAVVRVGTRFHTALETGDTTTIKQLLAPDLRVLESGAVETRADYIAHHLAADIEFAKSVRSGRTHDPEQDTVGMANPRHPLVIRPSPVLIDQTAR